MPAGGAGPDEAGEVVVQHLAPGSDRLLVVIVLQKAQDILKASQRLGLSVFSM